MAKVVEFEMDLEEWGKAVSQLQLHLGKSIPKVLKQSAALFVRDAIRLTPPMGSAPITESMKIQRRIGELAIKNDLLGTAKGRGHKTVGIFHIMDKSTLKIIRKFEKQNEGRTHESLVMFGRKKDGTPLAIQRQLFRANATMGEMHKHHQSQRTKRGRVTSAGRRTRDVGRWKDSHKMFVSNAAFNRYYKSVIKRVGKAKSGWWKAGKKLGVKGIPKWATFSGRGGVRGEYKESNKNNVHTITVGNRVEYIQWAEAKFQVTQRAYKNQIRNLKKRIESAIKYNVKKAGF